MSTSHPVRNASSPAYSGGFVPKWFPAEWFVEAESMSPSRISPSMNVGDKCGDPIVDDGE